MMRRHERIWTAILILLVSGCGGGGGGSGVTNVDPPVFSYTSAYYAYTTGVPTQAVTPTLQGGGQPVSWSINPALPPGLAIGATDGRIAGQPTNAAAAKNYTVTAVSAGGGQSSFTLSIAVAAAPLLDLGLTTQVTLLRFANSRVLSQEIEHRWLLQDYATGTTLASGNGSGAVLADGYGSNVDLENDVMIDQASAGLEVRSASDGHVLATIPEPAKVSWYRLAIDGSYVAAGTPTDLIIWSTAGQLLVSHAGDYSKAVPFAAPSQILVAQGPAGTNVIETVSATGGMSSVSPVFLGVFNTWFVDGQRFLTNVGNTVWTYSSTAVPQDQTTVTTVGGLAGQGNWFWTIESLVLNIYQVGASVAPAFSAPTGEAAIAFPSGGTIGVTYGGPVLMVVDLSGAAPISATYTLPYLLYNYAAQSATEWLVGDYLGVVFDGASLGGPPRTLTLGAAASIAGGTRYFSVATRSGTIFFNTSDNSQAGTLGFQSSLLSTSSDGTVLAAVAAVPTVPGVTQPLNIYSLPSGALINAFSYSYPTNFSAIALSSSGTLIAEILQSSVPAGLCVSQVIPAMGGTPIFCDNTGAIGTLRLSPDGTLVAASNPGSKVGPYITNVYKNGTLVVPVPGLAAMWLDNNRLLVNENSSTQTSPAIYDSLGVLLSSGSAAPNVGYQCQFGPVLCQVASTDSLYNPYQNVIQSYTTGATQWASGNASIPGIGAVAGSTIVFSAGDFVLAQPY